MGSVPPVLGGLSACPGEAMKGFTVARTPFTIARHGQHAHLRRRDHGAFTLVEVLIVILILAVLAAIVVPQFTSAAANARDSSLKMDLMRVRTQLQIYQAQHRGSWPTLANFVAQMTQASDATGATAAPGTDGYPYGPYLLAIPVNPLLPSDVVSNGAVGSSGWYYDEATGEFLANDSLATRQY